MWQSSWLWNTSTPPIKMALWFNRAPTTSFLYSNVAARALLNKILVRTSSSNLDLTPVSWVKMLPKVRVSTRAVTSLQLFREGTHFRLLLLARRCLSIQAQRRSCLSFQLGPNHGKTSPHRHCRSIVVLRDRAPYLPWPANPKF